MFTTCITLLFAVFGLGLVSTEKRFPGEPLEFTEEHRANIIGAHNHVRSHNATPVSSDMRRVTWDDELAYIAREWSKNCEYRENSVATTERWKTLGQSFFLAKPDTDWTPEIHFKAIGKWLWQTRHYNYDTETCQENLFCLEYLNMINSNTFKVGCGASKCKEMKPAEQFSDKDVIFYTCNYGPKGDFNRTYMPQPFLAGNYCTSCAPEDTCHMKLCQNAARDAEVIYVPPVVVEEYNLFDTGGAIAGVAAGIAFLIGSLGTAIGYLKKLKRVLPVVDESDLSQRAETGDGNSKPPSPVLENRQREAEVEMNPTGDDSTVNYDKTEERSLIASENAQNSLRRPSTDAPLQEEVSTDIGLKTEQDDTISQEQLAPIHESKVLETEHHVRLPPLDYKPTLTDCDAGTGADNGLP